MKIITKTCVETFSSSGSYHFEKEKTMFPQPNNPRINLKTIFKLAKFKPIKIVKYELIPWKKKEKLPRE